MSIDNLFFSLGVYRQPFLFGNSSRPLLIIHNSLKKCSKIIKNGPPIISGLHIYFKWMSIDNFFARVNSIYGLNTNICYSPFYNPHVTTQKNVTPHVHVTHREAEGFESREKPKASRGRWGEEVRNQKLHILRPIEMIYLSDLDSDRCCREGSK
jgi:hypothetical protein